MSNNVLEKIWDDTQQKWIDIYRVTLSGNVYHNDIPISGKIDKYDEHLSIQHAPINAQKNSDITKTEIESVLIGDITSHRHQITRHDVGLSNVLNVEQASKEELILLNDDFNIFKNDINSKLTQERINAWDNVANATSYDGSKISNGSISIEKMNGDFVSDHILIKETIEKLSKSGGSNFGDISTFLRMVTYLFAKTKIDTVASDYSEIIYDFYDGNNYESIAILDVRQGILSHNVNVGDKTFTITYVNSNTKFNTGDCLNIVNINKEMEDVVIQEIDGHIITLREGVKYNHGIGSNICSSICKINLNEHVLSNGHYLDYDIIQGGL